MPADAPRRRPGVGGAHGSAEHAGGEREQSLHRGAFRRRAVTDREASTAMRDDRRDPMAPRDTLNARLTAVFLALAVAIPVLGVLWYWLNAELDWWGRRDRKSTRLNSSHVRISYAVF